MLQNKIYRYFSQNPNLHVLFIFDPADGMCELDELQWQDGYKYIVFDGTWFTTKYRIENDYRDMNVIIRFRQLNPLKSSTARNNFPLLGLLCANMVFQEDSAEQFMQEYNLLPAADGFVRQHISELQLDKYKRILRDYLTPESFSIEIGRRAIISADLGATTLLTWEQIFIELITQAVNDPRKREAFYRQITANTKRDLLDVLQQKAIAIFGVEYNLNQEERMRDIAESLKYNALTQLLTAVANDRYKHLKITNQQSIRQLNNIFATTAQLPKAKRIAFEEAFRHLSQNIHVDDIVSVYGINADYFYVPEKLCYEIIKQLLTSDIYSAPDESLERLNLLSLKLEGNTVALAVIDYCQMLAAYYDKQKSMGSLILNTPQDYINRYTEHFYLIDFYYRKTLQVLPTTIPMEIEMEIRGSKERLDSDYAAISNNFNCEWSKCLQEKGDGFQSISLPRQYDFFNEQIDQSVKQVVIICDALRYEIATEVMQRLSESKHKATLTPALAVMPTETKFCKPAMYPHADSFYICTNPTPTGNTLDMCVDNQILNSLQKRKVQLQKYITNSDCIKAQTLLEGNTTELRELFKKPLVYIYYDILDTIAHEGDRESVTKVCNRAVEDIARMVNTLHASLNVSNVIITSDHGFIFNDKPLALHEKLALPTDTLEYSHRYYITSQPQSQYGVIHLPLNMVSGVTNAEYVAVPMGTNRFTERGGGYEFTHGGASLQELIIPIIKSKVRKINDKQPVNVVLVTSPNSLKVESSRITIKLFQAESVSMSFRERVIKVALYDGMQPVTEVKQFSLHSPSTDTNLRMISVDLLLNTSAPAILQLRVYDADDMLNPLIEQPVTNNTLIPQDF